MAGAGIGLAATVFALADAYAWKPLPYADPDRLVSIELGLPVDPAAWSSATQVDVPSVASWQARTDLFEGIAAFDDLGWVRVRLPNRILPIRAVAATDNLLEVLGLGPRSDSSDPAAAWVSSRVASVFSAADVAPGRSLSVLPDGLLRVSGVLPRTFLLPQSNRTLPVDAIRIRPAGAVMTKQGASNRTQHLVARVRPGITPQVIEAALGATMPGGPRISVVPLPEAMTARVRALALGALAASGLIVLLCWTNIFNIALTDGLYRGTEMATRAALGATPRRIAALLMTDGLHVAAIGSAAALAVAWLTLAAAVLVLPPQFSTFGVPSLTTRVVLAVMAASAVAGASWWVASILAWRIGVRRPLRQGASGDGRAVRVVRFGLVASELAVASVLLTGAALLGRSYKNLLGVDPGMDERTQTLTVAHDSNLSLALRQDVVSRVLGALQKAPSVEAVGVSDGEFVDGRNKFGTLRFHGRMLNFPEFDVVAGDYFEAMGLEFVAGGPPAHGEAAAVINESMAQRNAGGHMSVGDVLITTHGENLPVVGIVRGARSKGLDLAPVPAVYEVGSVQGAAGRGPIMTYLIRTAERGSSRSAGWAQLVQRVDPMAIVLDSGTIGERLGRSVRDRTFTSLVVGMFALASILVTTLGLAGVVAYTVVKRTREIAIRVALGATGASATRLVVRETLVAAACGIVAGVIASAWLSSGLESLLFGIDPTDPATFAIAAAGLLAIVLGTALVPARRAACIQPATALRIE